MSSVFFVFFCPAPADPVDSVVKDDLVVADVADAVDFTIPPDLTRRARIRR
jgi:hypothetical protein